MYTTRHKTLLLKYKAK